MNEFAEKRDFQRMALDCEFCFRRPSDNQQYTGQVINLSSKGILFTSSESVEVDTALEILVTPSNSITPPMEASVVVSRVTNNQSIYEIACEIVDIRN